MKTVKLIAIAVAAITVASCCSCRTKSRGAGNLTANSWQLIQIDGAAVTADGEKYTLQFSGDNRVSGMGDCNRLTGGYTSDQSGKLTFEGTASTRMLCPDQQGEDRFMKAFTDVDGYRIDGNTLMLLNNGQTVMVFKKI